MRFAILTWVIVVLSNQLVVSQKILIVNVVNGQTPNGSQPYQATDTTTQESTDVLQQFLGRKQQSRANKLPYSIQLGKTIMSKVTKKASI